MREWAISTVALALLACGATPDPGRVEPALSEPEMSSATSPSVLPCSRIVWIQVHKSDRILRAHCAGGALVEMTAAVGREPLGHKRATSDLRTPEGRYRISGSATPSRFHAFIPIDYPSVPDADRALTEGRIGSRDHARIVDAHARGIQPPNDTPLGGDIGLHGEGSRWAGDSAHLDWTLGCIALSDRDLEFLISRIEPGVLVDIQP